MRVGPKIRWLGPDWRGERTFEVLRLQVSSSSSGGATERIRIDADDTFSDPVRVISQIPSSKMVNNIPIVLASSKRLVLLRMKERHDIIAFVPSNLSIVQQDRANTSHLHAQCTSKSPQRKDAASFRETGLEFTQPRLDSYSVKYIRIVT